MFNVNSVVELRLKIEVQKIAFFINFYKGSLQKNRRLKLKIFWNFREWKNFTRSKRKSFKEFQIALINWIHFYII